MFINGNTSNSDVSETTVFADNQIPGIKLYDQHSHLVDVADFKGQPILINFWATWCAPCKEEIPLLVEYSEKYPQLKIIGISSYEARSTVENFLEKTPVSYLILMDSDGKIANQFQVIGYPTSLFVDAEGVLRYTHLGQLDASLLDDSLEQIGIAP